MKNIKQTELKLNLSNTSVSNLKFKPKINEKSKKIAESNQNRQKINSPSKSPKRSKKKKTKQASDKLLLKNQPEKKTTINFKPGVLSKSKNKGGLPNKFSTQINTPKMGLNLKQTFEETCSINTNLLPSKPR